MESPFSGRERLPQLDTLGQQVKPPMPEMGYILLSHWSKKSPTTTPNITDYCQHHWLLSITRR